LGIVKIVLISTYELGRQPFGLVSPAAWLRAVGHEVTCMDLTRQELDDGGNSYRGKDCNLSSDAHGDTVSGAADSSSARKRIQKRESVATGCMRR